MTTNTEGQVHLRCGAFEKQFKLSWTQKNILDKTEDVQYVLVAGPPGTGKTTVLLLKGLQWLDEGRDVLVCSIHKNSVPTCCYLYTVLSEAKKARDSARCPEDSTETGLVKYSNFELSDKQEVDNALDQLQASAPKDRPPGFLFDYMFPETLDLCQLALDFIKELKDRLPQSPIWTSDWYSSVPEGFFVQQMMTPLRYTQQIFSLIKLPVDALVMSNQLPSSYKYHTAVYRQPSAGPEVIHLRHKGSRGGVDKWPVNSEKCGRKVAKVLRQIGVGVGATEGETNEAEGEQQPTDQGDHYQYRDVLVLTRNELLPGHTPAFARGLEAAGIPTAVCCPGDDVTVEEALSDVILAPEDKVVVMNNQAAIGLDRKVVVCLTGIGKDETWEVTAEENRQIQADELQAGTFSMGDTTLTLTLSMNARQKKEFREKVQRSHWSEMELIHRLTIWTRCCRQLLVVHLPEDVQGPREFKMDDSLMSCAIL